MTKRNYNRIPTHLTEEQFGHFIFPCLIIPTRVNASKFVENTDIPKLIAVLFDHMRVN